MNTKPAFGIRVAELPDVPAITEIYNEAVLTTVATFDLEPRSIDDRTEWFLRHDSARHPVIVAESAGTRRVLGWASLSRWSDKCAYDGAAEVSLYVAASARGRGVGKALLTEILRLGREAGLHTVISRITGGNEVSLRLHDAFGFTHVGTMKEMGLKFGRVLDVEIFQLLF
jgi:L-amino acid N-acyltransferase YncA